MPPLSNIQSIITYFQTNPPDGSVSEGDIWYNPDDREAFIFIDDVWQQIEVTPITPGHMYGYSIAGREVTSTSLIERIEFPFDTGTAVSVGTTTANLVRSSSCNSSLHGFVFGGLYRSTIQRFDFPFSSGVATDRGTMQDSKGSCGSFNDSRFGFIIGGEGISPLIQANIEKFEFPFDTGESFVVGILDDNNRNSMSSCASSRYGYIMGGRDSTTSPSHLNSIVRFEFPFSSGSTGQISSELSDPRSLGDGCNSTTHGYSIGGTEGPLTWVDTVERFTFALDTTTVEVGVLAGTKYRHATCNSTRFGYVFGGKEQITGGLSTIERFEFPFSSGTALASGNLNSTRFNNTGLDGTQFWF